MKTLMKVLFIGAVTAAATFEATLVVEYATLKVVLPEFEPIQNGYKEYRRQVIEALF